MTGGLTWSVILTALGMMAALAVVIWRASSKFAAVEFQLADLATELKKTREEEFKAFKDELREQRQEIARLKSFKERVRREMGWDRTPVHGTPITNYPKTKRKSDVEIEGANIFGKLIDNEDDEEES